MQLIATQRHPMTPRAAAWSPVKIQLDAAFRATPNAPEIVVTTFHVPTTPTATYAQAEARVKVWRSGTLIDDQAVKGAAHARERQLAAAMVDALRGSNFLKDARVTPTVESIAVGSVRITAVDADGTRRAVTMAMDADPGSYAAFDTAADAYIGAIFPG